MLFKELVLQAQTVYSMFGYVKHGTDCMLSVIVLSVLPEFEP